jgi:hypothetical protein
VPTDTETRIESTVAAWREWCLAQGLYVSPDDRVSETTCALLIGHKAAYLRQMRTEGRGPVAYARGVDGCRISYRLADAAQWLEAGRDNFDVMVANSR